MQVTQYIRGTSCRLICLSHILDTFIYSTVHSKSVVALETTKVQNNSKINPTDRITQQWLRSTQPFHTFKKTYCIKSRRKRIISSLKNGGTEKWLITQQRMTDPRIVLRVQAALAWEMPLVIREILWERRRLQRMGRAQSQSRSHLLGHNCPAALGAWRKGICRSPFPDVLYRRGSLCLLFLEAFPHLWEALQLRSQICSPSLLPPFSMLKCWNLSAPRWWFPIWRT